MNIENISFTYFKEYANFLLTNHLNDITQVDLQRSKDLDVPILRYFDHLSEVELFELSKKGITEYLQSIANEKAIEAAITANEAWKSNNIGVPREQVVASDIALIYNIRKHSLRHFLVNYTSDIQKIISVLDEIDDYYTVLEEMAIKTIVEINQEVIRDNELKLKQAQELVTIGYWEYDMESGQIKWSDELYKIYGFEKESQLASQVIESQIFKDDLAEFKSKVDEIRTNGGSFTHEYRITTKDGEIKYLIDKGYTEKLNSGKLLVKGVSQDITKKKLNENKIAEHDYFMKNMAEIAPYVISVYDFIENKIIYINKNTSELLGFTDDEIKSVGLSVVNLVFHPEDAGKINSLLERSRKLNDLEFEEVEYRVKAKDGGWKWLLSRISPFKRNEKGEVIQIISILSDVNDKVVAVEEIKRKEKLLKEAQEISHLGSWEWNTETQEIQWSDEMYRIFGYQPGEIVVELDKYMSHIHPEDKDMVSDKVSFSLSSGDAYDFEHRVIRQDGKTIWLQAKGQVTLKENGKNVKLAGTAMDITEQKKYADALKSQTEALTASNKELEAFCYTISHDLRSPLRAIDGFGRKLNNQYASKLDDEGQRLLGIVRSNAQQMGVLIDSLLEFSRLNRKEIKKSEIHMEELVQKVIQNIRDQNPDHQAEFNISPLSIAIGDAQLIHQVWSNLISNAVKFSSKTQQPQIEIGCEKKGKMVTYYVKDNGAGFDMEYADKLFGVFQRLHTEDEFTGTGVGLATVQRIIHRHGGRVWAEGKPEKGAAFYFTLYTQDVPQPILTLN